MLLPASKLSSSCARLVVGRVTTLWLKHPPSGRQQGYSIPPGPVNKSQPMEVGAVVMDADGRTHGERCGLPPT